MIYTNHAQKRINQRNYTTAMLDDALVAFSKMGKWDQRNERVTLRTNTDEFHSYLRSLTELFQTVKARFLQFKRQLKKTDMVSSEHQNHLQSLKQEYKSLKSMLSNLKLLEHKGAVTLVIVDNVVLTVFKPLSHFKRDCTRAGTYSANEEIMRDTNGEAVV